MLDSEILMYDSTLRFPRSQALKFHLFSRPSGKSSHVSFYTASLGMMVKG